VPDIVPGGVQPGVTQNTPVASPDTSVTSSTPAAAPNTINPGSSALPPPSSATPAAPGSTPKPTPVQPEFGPQLPGTIQQASMATKVQMAAKAAPKLDPQTTVAAAQAATSGTDAAQKAAMVNAYNWAVKAGKALTTVNTKMQLAYWSKATGPTRSLLVAAGYEPPNAPPQAAEPTASHGLLGGFWHDAVHEADNVRHGAASASKGALDVAGKVASVGTSQVAHAARTYVETMEKAGSEYGRSSGDFQPVKFLEAVTTPSNYVDAWNASQNGASSFNPIVVRALAKTLPAEQLVWAKIVAGGGNLQTQLAQLPANERAQAYVTIQTDPTFQNAVEKLSDAHLTPGEAIFGTGGIGSVVTGNALTEANPTVNAFGVKAHVLSGAVDGYLDWIDSPLILGSQLHAASTLSRFSVADALGNARDLRVLTTSDSAVQRGMQTISDALTDGGSREIGDGPNISKLLSTPGFNTLNPMADQFEAAWPEIQAAAREGNGAAAVTEVFAGDQGLIALAQGKAGLFYHNATLFPHVTVPQQLRIWTQSGLDNLIHNTRNLDADSQSARQMVRSLFGDAAERDAVASDLKLPGPAARFMRRATTISPLRDFINLQDDERASAVQRWADIALPKSLANEFVNYFMSIPVTDEGRARLALQGLQSELFSAMNIDQTVEGRAYIEDWFRRQDDATRERYSVGDNALYAEPHNDVADSARQHAILPSQLSTQMKMPKPLDLFRLAKHSWLSDTLGNDGVDLTKVEGATNRAKAIHLWSSAKLDTIMKYWKASILFRPGFGLRIAGEEVYGAGLRNGFIPLAQARVAASLLGLESPALADATKIPRVLKAITSHMPGEALDAIKDLRVPIDDTPIATVIDRTDPHAWAKPAPTGTTRAATSEEKMAALQAQVNGWTTMHVLRKAGVKFVPQHIMDSTMWLALNGRFDGSWADSIDAVMQHGGIVNDEHGTSQAFAQWKSDTGTLRMRPNGTLGAQADYDPLTSQSYHYSLSGLLDKLPQSVAATFDSGPEAQFDTAMNWMHDPANAAEIKRFDVSQMTKDGRLVADGTATQEEAFRDWAHAIVTHVNNLVGPLGHQVQVSLNGETHGLADLVAQGAIPNTTDLDDISRSELPDEAVARQLIPIAETDSMMKGILSNGMRLMVGRPLNYISRLPIFNMHFSTAFNETKDLLASRGIEDVGDKLAGDIAEDRAYREVMPYIHNPAVRSQLSVITRNLAPFWFAQEQFYKRWAMTFAKYPEAFRKAQLIMNGMRSVGFIQTDAYGQDSFVYPGSGAVSSFLTHIFNGKVPVMNQFTSEINELNPSFGSGGVVSAPMAGPLIALPMVTLNAYLPQLDPTVAALLGPSTPADTQGGLQGMALALFQQATPTVIQRIVETFAASSGPGDPLYSSMKATAVIQAAQYLESQGLGPPANADAEQEDVFQSRVQSWALTIMALRVAFGFVAPGTPSLKISGSDLGQQYYDLLADMPYDQAIAAFLKVNPDAQAYTVAASTDNQPGQSDAYIPETQGALQFIQQNLSFFKNYSAAAPWLLPLSTQKGVFNDNAYLQELATGIRTKEDFSQWYSAVRIAQGSNVYYAMEDKINALATDNGKQPYNGQQKLSNGMTISQWWDQWKTAYKAANPIFGTWVDEDPSQPRKQEVINQMEAALKATALPRNATTEHMALLMGGYEQLSDYYDATQGNSNYTSQYIENKNAFIAQGNAFAKAYPDVAPFWTSVLRPEIMENYGNAHS
jgi:hypothetical protein